MGRKPFLKLKKRANVAESTVPTVSEVQLGHDNSNSFLQPESSKQPANSSLEGVELNLQMQADFAKPSSKKKAKQTGAKVRRSERLQTLAADAQNQDIERKEDYTLKMLEVQCKTADVKCKATKNSFSENCSGGGDITYKSLYIDSEKKVEALMEKNYQLTLKLQNALGKIEAYEKGNPMVCDMLKKFFEILLPQLSPEAGLQTAAKRKKFDEQTRGNGHSDSLM
ncbi:TITIN-LIKE ISOFORM X2 [Salix viminalis]|uniref:TITIN-LIKE ISOFORM X2 n=1 Tax=Salix viminalis TaxID=40686 RepID=A0A9Q0UIJ1_SALVM|nr:TITIN-LIKE ISOFORM X2 [Salix viminalis]